MTPREKENARYKLQCTKIRERAKAALAAAKKSHSDKLKAIAKRKPSKGPARKPTAAKKPTAKTLEDAPHASIAESVKSIVEPKPAPNSTKLLATLQTMNRKRPGTLLVVNDVRKASGLSKAAFAAAAFDLRKSRDVVLHYHDHAGALSKAERATLLVDALGTHYVGIALDPVKYR